MGANASKIDDGLASLGENIDRIHEQPSFPASASSAPNVQKTMLSSSTQRLAVDQNRQTRLLRRSGSARLPPVESHDVVRAQIAKVAKWNLADGSEDLWVSTPSQNRRVQHSIHQAANVTQPPGTHGLAAVNHSPDLKRYQSPPTLRLNKKPRLLPTQQATQIASKQPGFYGRSSTRGGWTAQETSIGTMEDEGYNSFTVSPTDVSESTHTPSADDETEVDLVRSLANLQQSILTPTPTETLQDARLDDEECLEAMELLKAQEEQAGAERSRILRERALMRQRAELPPEPLQDPNTFCASSTELRDEPDFEDEFFPGTFEDFDAEFHQPYSKSSNGPVATTRLTSELSDGLDTSFHQVTTEPINGSDHLSGALFEDSEVKSLHARPGLSNRAGPVSTKAFEHSDATFRRSFSTFTDDENGDVERSNFVPYDEEVSAFELRDIAMRHESIPQTESEDSVTPRQGTRDSIRSTRKPNPTSRAAAEKFRTQDRHIRHSNHEFQSEHAPGTTSLQDREDRLRKAKISVYTNHPMQDSHATVDGHDLSSTAASPRRQIDPQPDNGLHNGANHNPKMPYRPSGLEMLASKNARSSFWDQSDHRGASKAPVISQSFETGLGLGLSETESSRSSLVHRRRLDDHTSSERRPALLRPHFSDGDEESTSQSGSRSKSVSTKIERSLVLPKNFHTLKEEDKSIIVQHETLKERRRDLEVIDRVTRSIAYLRCAGCFSPREENEFAEVLRFMKLVLRENKYGKLARKRIQDIRTNMEHRSQGLEANKDEVDQWYYGLFDRNDLTKLRQSLTDIQGEISDLGEIRNELVSKRNRNHKKKAVTFDLSSSQNQTPTRRPPRLNRRNNSGNATENRRNAQYARQDRQIELLREKLGQFNSGLSEDLPQSSQGEFDSFPGNDSDRESNISEDTTGAEFYHGLSQNDSNAAPEAQSKVRLDTTKQCDSAPLIGSQRPDPELLERMRAKQNSAANRPQIVEDVSEITETGLISPREEVQAVEDENECTSDEETDDEDEDDKAPKQFFKYTVWGTFFGVDGYTDNDRYEFKKTYNLQIANQNITFLVDWFKQKYASIGIGVDQWDFHHKFDHGMIEQQMDLGPDMKVSMRFSMTREIVSLGEKAYRRARFKTVVVREFVYIVDWKHITTPVPEGVDAPEGQAQTQQGTDQQTGPDGCEDDDLFDPEATNSTPVESITTVCPASELRHYNDVATANREASQRYLEWHFKFLPGLPNEGYRRLESDSTEEYLKRLADIGHYDRSNTLYGEIEVEEGEGEGEGEREESLLTREDDDGNQSALTQATASFTAARRQRVQEWFRVWVRKERVFGPGN